MLKTLYKKIHIIIFLLSAFYLIYVYLWTENLSKNSKNLKADILDDIIYEWEPDRTFSPSMVFYPDNKVVLNWCSANSCSYYVLNVPDDTIDIGVDNITSSPHCQYWWRYKFQWFPKYFKIWERVTDSDVNFYEANYPLLQTQDWTNRNYLIDWVNIYIYFDKNIKNAQFYNFALRDWVTVYKDYKTWFTANVMWVSIVNWNQLKIETQYWINWDPSNYYSNYWRIVIKKNIIADMDWRVIPNDLVVWDGVTLESWEIEYIIDNRVPKLKENEDGFSEENNGSWSTKISLIFDENIFENSEWPNILDNIKVYPQNKLLKDLDGFVEYDIEQNIVNLFFTWEDWSINNALVEFWVFADKVWNLNNQWCSGNGWYCP
jgi:hypothetical protein